MKTKGIQACGFECPFSYNKLICKVYWHLASRKERKDMHMADALVAPAVAGTMYACSGAAMGYSMKKVRLENAPEKIPEKYHKGGSG